MPRAVVKGDEKGSGSFRTDFLKGKIKAVQRDCCFPHHAKKSHNETEMLRSRYVSRKQTPLTLCCNCCEL